MSVSITSFYAVLLTLLFMVLSVRVVRLRGMLKTTIGDGGDERLRRAMRAHANFAEYVPLALLLSALLELAPAPAALVHALGASLLVGRLLHAYGVSRSPEPLAYRVAGMAFTFGALGVGAAGLALVQAARILG